MAPFDNATLRMKTVWTDEELKGEIELLNAAIEVLEKLGDRYDLVLADLRAHKNVRDNMAIARKWDA